MDEIEGLGKREYYRSVVGMKNYKPKVRLEVEMKCYIVILVQSLVKTGFPSKHTLNFSFHRHGRARVLNNWLAETVNMSQGLLENTSRI